MAKQMKVTWAILFAVSLQFGCIKAPVEFTLDKEIEITESEVNNLAEKIYDNLAELDFKHPVGGPTHFIDPDECATAYREWLRHRFDEGLIPRGTILPSEYAKAKLSSNPLISQCRSINFDEEYQRAAQMGAQKTEREGLLFDPSQIRDALIENKCIEKFIDPDQEKLQITGMSLFVRENTLSVPAPRYKVYTSDEYLTKAEFAEDDAETKLINSGSLMLLGETEPIPRHFAGKLPLKLVEDYEAFRNAEVPAISLDGTIVALPNSFGSDPETITIAGKSYFVLPKGKLRLTLVLYLDVRGELIEDPLCIYREFKDQIRKDEAERKKKP